MFISKSKYLHFEHADIWWINILTKLCYFLILKVMMSRIIPIISSCIWHWFVTKVWRILFIFNYQFLWYSCFFRYLWHWICCVRYMPSFFFFALLWVDTPPYFKIILHCWMSWNKISVYNICTLVKFFLSIIILDLWLGLFC